MRTSNEYWKRTHMCGELDVSNCGQEVTLAGWVQKKRNLGSLLFIDLRDRTGITQLTIDLSNPGFSEAEKIRSEYVVTARGVVQMRPAEQQNSKLSTGKIEVKVTEIKILNQAETPPFYIIDDVNADEGLRLKYRYLDLRRPEIQNAIIMRHKITKAIRDYLDSTGFVEIETPILTKSTPEGARDYLVPSRVNKGTFYALPQSPQIFKQLLMVGGYDRYFQIARCFRDEDLRADRQPEFTQVDIEMSFVSEEDVRGIAEGMVKSLFSKILDYDLGSDNFSLMSYQVAMDKYGTDKPDIRFGLEIEDVTDVFKESDFRVFKDAIASGGVIRSITIPQISFSRKELDTYTNYAKQFGAKGLIWIAYGEEGIRSSIKKFLSEKEIKALAGKAKVQKGDLAFIVSADKDSVSKSLGALRLKIGKDLSLIDESKWSFLWVVDFPVFEYNEEQGRFTASHHPFTMPKEEDLERLVDSPALARAKAYDLVLNGVEIGGGSIRIHNRDIQNMMFEALGFSEEEAHDKFGFFLEALKYGTPPHGGIAFGLDRLIMEMLHLKNIRDVIAFPKTTSASSLMSGAPGAVAEQQLSDLHIKSGK